MLNTIVVSDLHLGMPEAKYNQLLSFLSKNPCKNLIINWDLVDWLYIKILWKRKNEFDIFFNKLEKITSINKTKIFYIKGNHEVFIKKIKPLKKFKKIWYINLKTKHTIFVIVINLIL